jgi:hypothetical protein
MPKERIEEIKSAIDSSDKLTLEEKSQSIQHLEEWIAEDKAFGVVFNELMEVNEVFKEIFKELGLV